MDLQKLDLQWLEEQELLQRLEAKRELLSFLNRKAAASSILEAFEAPEKIKKEKYGDLVPDCFFVSDEFFDLEKAAGMLSDYEVALLGDLVEEPQRTIKIEYGSLAKLEEGEGLLVKTYDRLHTGALSWLAARNLLLIDKELGEETKWFKAIRPRAKLLFQAATRLAAYDVEQLELWGGMPNLYRKASRLENPL